MKKLLWDYMEVEKPIPTRALLPSSPENTSGNSVSIVELCAAKAGTVLDDADFISAIPVEAPFILFLAFFLLPWALFRMLRQRNKSHPPYFYSTPAAVPIYLKLGRLIYYS